MPDLPGWTSARRRHRLCSGRPLRPRTASTQDRNGGVPELEDSAAYGARPCCRHHASYRSLDFGGGPTWPMPSWSPSNRPADLFAARNAKLPRMISMTSPRAMPIPTAMRTTEWILLPTITEGSQAKLSRYPRSNSTVPRHRCLDACSPIRGAQNSVNFSAVVNIRLQKALTRSPGSAPLMVVTGHETLRLSQARKDVPGGCTGANGECSGSQETA